MRLWICGLLAVPLGLLSWLIPHPSCIEPRGDAAFIRFLDDHITSVSDKGLGVGKSQLFAKGMALGDVYCLRGVRLDKLCSERTHREGHPHLW